MILATTNEIAGKKTLKTLGVARGSTIEARHIGQDILAVFRMILGGELKNYTEMMAKAREEALARMISVAEEMGANAIVGMRFSSVMIMSGTAECVAYGTAVIIEE